jgi:hypothetical protein
MSKALWIWTSTLPISSGLSPKQSAARSGTACAHLQIHLQSTPLLQLLRQRGIHIRVEQIHKTAAPSVDAGRDGHRQLAVIIVVACRAEVVDQLGPVWLDDDAVSKELGEFGQITLQRTICLVPVVAEDDFDFDWTADALVGFCAPGEGRPTDWALSIDCGRLNVRRNGRRFD